MKIPEIIENVEVISQLGDTPGADDGLTSEQLKAKFDEAAVMLKAYINKYVVPAINNYVAGDDGYLSTLGGTMFGTLNMGNQKISNVPVPAAKGDATPKSYVDSENQRFLESGKEYANGLTKAFERITVPLTAWVEDGKDKQFPWTASISIGTVRENMAPSVVFGTEEAVSGDYAPSCETFDGGIYIHAKKKPDREFIIPTLVLWRIIK